MTTDTKAKIKVLEYLTSALKMAQRARDPRERLAACELEVELTDRIEQLKRADNEPELFGSPQPPALAAAAGGGR